MELLLIIPVLLLSIIIHEVAHGWVALREGDATAYMLGRLTLNPIPHIDPVGSIIVPAVLLLTHASFLFGWAKPVPVNPRNYRNFKRGDILVSIAGITANLLLAVACTLLTVIVIYLSRLLPFPALLTTFGLLVQMLRYGILINLVLAFFNLIPIPPLDGSHLFYYLLPPRLGMQYRQLGQYGLLILIGVFVFMPGLVNVLLTPVALFDQLAQTVIQALT